jgi:outer membrane protein, heavy metal efflux system
MTSIGAQRRADELPMFIASSPRRGPWPLAALALAALAIPPGCARYERRTIDLTAHRAEFLLRTPTTPEASSPERSESHGTTDLSVNDAELVALLLNPALRVARAELGIAEASAREAGRWDDPVFEADIARILESVAEPWEAAGALRLTLPISGRLDAERARAGAARDAELLRVQSLEWETRLAVREAFADLVAARRRRAELSDDIRRVDAVVELVDRLEQSGEISRLQSRLFRIESATRRDLLRGAELAEHDGEVILLTLLGLPAQVAVQFVEEFPSAVRPEDRDLRERFPRGAPAIELAMAEYETYERSLDLAIREQYPDLSLAPGLSREGGEGVSNRLLLGVSLPIPIFNGNARAIAEATAARSASEARVRTLVERQSNDLERALARRATALERRDRFVNELVPLVEAQLEDARRIAELGEIDALVLLETLSRRADVRLAFIDAEREAVAAAVAIDRIIGPSIASSEVQP